jgi:hypothetical protein
MHQTGMAGVSDRGARGLALLAAHLASFEVERRDARERLEDELGGELARKLVFALCNRAGGVRTARTVAV